MDPSSFLTGFDTGGTRLRNFRQLNVWRKAHDLAVAVYRATDALPKTERFGLTSQMRRSAASIGANIAEGCGRGGRTELARFLRVAAGSASELEDQLLLACDVGFLDPSKGHELTAAAAEVRRMLAGYIRSLKAEG